MSQIQLDNLTRRYGRRRGVQRVSLSVPEGALFGFLGPNGAGKTTTIRVMLGFLRPTSVAEFRMRHVAPGGAVFARRDLCTV